jgi:hypothetical protein
VFGDKTGFWVFFDTCTKQKYYEDVHNLLAAPPHTLLTYDYSQQHISPRAISAAANPKSAPLNVLLIYTQDKNYKKGDKLPDGAKSDQLIWIPTRFGVMKAIRPEGDRYYFDFAVHGYPQFDNDSLMRIMTSLIDRCEVPLIGNKWVTISDALQAFERLRGGNEALNWQSIVDAIGSHPSIFQGDSFWRLKAPVKVKGSKISIDNGLIEKTNASGTVYLLREGQRSAIEITSHTPQGLSPTHDETRTIKVCVHDGPLEIVGNPLIGLRRHTKTTLNLRSLLYEELVNKEGQLRFQTIAPQDTGWPQGPNIVLNFSIRKRLQQILLGMLLVLGSATAVFIANHIAESHLREAISLFIIGVSLGMPAAYLLFRRFVRKLF